MTRAFCIASAIALLVLGWIFFEVTNVWSINAGLIQIMRAIFAFGAIGSLVSLCFTRSRTLPPLCLAGAYVTIGFLTNGPNPTLYIILCALLVTLVAILGALVRRPLYVR